MPQAADGGGAARQPLVVSPEPFAAIPLNRQGKALRDGDFKELGLPDAMGDASAIPSPVLREKVNCQPS